MHHTAFWSIVTLGCVLGLVGCGDDDATLCGGKPCEDAAVGMDGSTTETDGGAQPDGGAPVDNGVRYDEAFSGTCGTPPRCEGDELETACVCAPAPSTEEAFGLRTAGCGELPMEGEAPRTFDDDFCSESGAGAADLDCFMSSSYRQAGPSEMVTLYGVVDVFGNGGDAEQILVEVYAEGADGALGDLLGSDTASIEDACAETESLIENDEVVGTRRLGFYAIENVPTETPLIVKTSGNANLWKPLYTYNFQIRNDEVVDANPPADGCASIPPGPRFDYRARTLSSSDYSNIPLTAGAGRIASNNGALAGEVHDCSDVRLAFAQVATSPVAPVTVYFTSNPSNPLPDGSRTPDGTGLLGLYAALDLPEGPVDVAAVGRVDDEIVSLGWYRARVFAGSVTVVTLKGLRPQQVPPSQ